MANVLDGLKRLGVKYLVTIGGDDTAFSGSQVYANAAGGDQGRPRPQDHRQRPAAARRASRPSGSRRPGTTACSSPATCTRTPRPPRRWYIIVSMGRAAGHLALGIGKASAATVTIIAEEFQGKEVTLELICDIIIGSMIKRKAQGKGYGARGPGRGADGEDRRGEAPRRSWPKNPGKFGDIELRRVRPPAAGRDRVRPHGPHRPRGTAQGPRASKFDMIDKDLGYELRCADPIPFDAEYTRNLGYGAVKFLLSPEADKLRRRSSPSSAGRWCRCRSRR